MQVNFQYAEEHLADLASAADAGQDVEISRPDKPILRLVVAGSQVPAEGRDRAGMIGSGKGKIWYAEDWDSPAANQEIAQLFNESELFPDEPGR